MRFIIVSVALGLVVLSGQFGADARAVPNNIGLSSSIVATRELKAYVVDKLKREVVTHIVPRVPAAPAPVIPRPLPVNPRPVNPRPVIPKPPVPGSPRPGERLDPEDAPLPEDQIGGCTRKRCAPEPRPLNVKETSLWKESDVEPIRKTGFQAHKSLDDVVAAKGQDKGFKGQQTDPSANVLTEGGLYKVESLPSEEVGDVNYLQDPKFKDLGLTSGTKWAGTGIKNNDAQIKAYDEWRGKTLEELNNLETNEDFDGHDKDFAISEFQTDAKPGAETVMLRTFEKPSQGSSKGLIIIKSSYNKLRDFFREYTYDLGGAGKFKRPETGKATRWSDQVMANWRAAVKRDGGDVKSLQYMARDNIKTEETQEVITAVLEQMGGSTEGFVTVRRTGGDEKESASFDALAGTVHGIRAIQMASDHHQELGGLKVNAFHIQKVPAYNMVIEFGRDSDQQK